jgi:Trypsin-like peptidase domain
MEWAQAVFRMKPWCVALVMLVMAAAVAARAQNPSGEDVALKLRSNVVRIVAHLGAGATAREGFGFMVGEDSGQLYIVTADHVVRGDGPDDIDKKPTVIFFQDPGKEYGGELLGTHLPRGRGDLAVLRIQSPPKFKWNRNAQAAASVERGTDVWFIGKLGEWYVPTRPGAVNEAEPSGTIRVEGLPVSVGTSGAPLISQSGILGMIVTDAGAFSEATPLDLVRRAIERWHYPWQLAPLGPQEPPQTAQRELGISITTAKSITEGTTVRGSLVPGQDRYFFQFKASSTKIRVILRKLSKGGFRSAVDVYDHNEVRVAREGGGPPPLIRQPEDQPISLSFKSNPGELYYVVVTALESNARGDYELTVRKE